MPTTQWFLTSRERGNPATRLDSRHHADVAWTEGNLVRPLIHGTAYLAAEENRQLGDEINGAGGQCLLDMRVRTGGHTTVRATTVVRVVIVTD